MLKKKKKKKRNILFYSYIFYSPKKKKKNTPDLSFFKIFKTFVIFLFLRDYVYFLFDLLSFIGVSSSHNIDPVADQKKEKKDGRNIYIYIICLFFMVAGQTEDPRLWHYGASLLLFFCTRNILFMLRLSKISPISRDVTKQSRDLCLISKKNRVGVFMFRKQTPASSNLIRRDAVSHGHARCWDADHLTQWLSPWQRSYQSELVSAI